ncbi:MAG: hypothetical protein ACRCV9_05495 [Burkholderiaceae bacterium]
MAYRLFSMFKPKYRKDSSFDYSPEQALQDKQINRGFHGLFLFCGPALLVGLTAWLSPNDVLDQYPVLAKFCSLLAQFFPFLLIHKSQFQQVTQLVLSISMLAVVIQFLCFMAAFWRGRHVYINEVRAGLAPLPSFQILLVTLVFLPLGFWGFWLQPGDPSFCKGCTTHSRFGLAIISTCAVWIMGGLPCLWVFYFYMKLKLPKQSNR